MCILNMRVNPTVIKISQVFKKLQFKKNTYYDILYQWICFFIKMQTKLRHTKKLFQLTEKRLSRFSSLGKLTNLPIKYQPFKYLPFK